MERLSTHFNYKMMARDSDEMASSLYAGARIIMLPRRLMVHYRPVTKAEESPDLVCVCMIGD